MRNKVKNIIVLVIVTLVISTITVTAALVTSANNITFSSSKTDKTNVNDSLNEIYDKMNTQNLTTENIKSGVNILGVNGSFTNDATADASKILSGYSAYVDGNKITGTYVAPSLTFTTIIRTQNTNFYNFQSRIYLRNFSSLYKYFSLDYREVDKSLACTNIFINSKEDTYEANMTTNTTYNISDYPIFVVYISGNYRCFYEVSITLFND